MNLDILVFASHPDDAELSCSGTIAKHIDQGRSVGVIDLTQGEMGTRGTPEIRAQETKASSAILNLNLRENLYMKDGFFQNGKEEQFSLIRAIRKYKPKIVLANAIRDRHPDHGKGAELAKSAVFLSGLRKVETELDGQLQEPYRPAHLFHYIQNDFIEPDFIVDISAHWQKKIDSIKAFRSQFFDAENDEPNTFISDPGFLKFIEARAQVFGHRIGVEYGEGFTSDRSIGVNDLFALQ